MKYFSSLLSSLLILIFVHSSTAQSFDGYALYNLQNQNTSYLIDKNGDIAKSWSCPTSCNYTVLLKEDGNIVRGAVYSGNQLNGAAIGGMVQEIDPSGSVVWEFVYSNSQHCSHHDIALMPNGHVLMTAWEVKTTAELTQAGRANATSSKWPTHIIEVQQNGSGGEIVWEWHMWDHMVQDYDPTKDNYDVVENHPELMDINAVSGGGAGGPGGSSGDWFHTNGIDYNPVLDQIVFSSRYASEIFIIDHSTTTAEAASHSGGNSGMGGDFIYRWGNPGNYGSSGTQTIPAAVHDPRWITDDGRPNGGFIQFFNNEGGASGGSVIDAIDAPETGYLYSLAGSSYGPANYDWRHVCLTSNTGQGAHNRMSNGNTFVNVSQQYMYEVDANDNLVWQYNASPTKAFRYECDDPGIIALLGNDPCGLLTLNEQTLNRIEFYPNPSSTGLFKIDGVAIEGSNLAITVVDVFGKVIMEIEDSEFIDLSQMPDGVFFARLVFNGEKAVTKKLSLLR